MLRVFNFEKLQPYTLKRYFTTTLENDGGVNATETMTFIYQSIRRARAIYQRRGMQSKRNTFNAFKGGTRDRYNITKNKDSN